MTRGGRKKSTRDFFFFFLSCKSGFGMSQILQVRVLNGFKTSDRNAIMKAGEIGRIATRSATYLHETSLWDLRHRPPPFADVPIPEWELLSPIKYLYIAIHITCLLCFVFLVPGVVQ